MQMQHDEWRIDGTVFLMDGLWYLIILDGDCLLVVAIALKEQL
jgi:hypothetical protein